MSGPEDAPMSELELAKLAAAINPDACRAANYEVAIKQAVELLAACRDFLAMEQRSFVQRAVARLPEAWLVILTTEPNDSAREWLRQNAANAKDKYDDPIKLADALTYEGIELTPATKEVALERIPWAIGEDAFKARFGDESAWAEYWQEHLAEPKIFPVSADQLQRFLDARRAKRAQQRQNARSERKRKKDMDGV